MSEIEELRCEIIANRVMVEKLQKRIARLEGEVANLKHGVTNATESRRISYETNQSQYQPSRYLP